MGGILLDTINNIFIMALIIIITFAFIALIISIIFNKIRKAKIDRDDYGKVKTFYNDILKKSHPGYINGYYAAVDYFETVEAICEEFLNGHKDLGQKQSDLIDDLKGPIIVNELKNLKLDFLNKEINEILAVIYKYYDERGVWRK